MSTHSDLRHGRAAFEYGAWAEAYEAFARADVNVPLSAGDLEDWATAAYLLGREHAFSGLLDRAHQRHLDRGDSVRAAYCACWLGLSLNGLSAHAQASGWFARARRLLAGTKESTVVHGYLQLADALGAVVAGDLETAFACGQQAVDTAERFREADLSALALQLLGRVQLRRSLPAEGLALLDEAMITVSSGALRPQVAGIVYCSVIDGCRASYSLQRAHEWTLALTRLCEQHPELIAFSGECRVARAEMLVLHGAWQDALAEAERAFERPAPWSARKITAAALYQRGEVYRLRGDFEAAERAYEAAGREGGRRQPGLALLRLAQGELEKAASGLSRVLEETREPLARARFLPARVSIALAGPDPDLGLAGQAAEELAGIAARSGATVLQTMTEHALGEVALAAGNALEAATRLRSAVEGWLELAAPYEAARTRSALASACRLLGDEEGADLESAAAALAFEELGAAPDLVRLAGLQGSGSGGSQLTDRELEVLRILAAGATNRSIGEQLAISDRTVDRHVSNIFDKLGVAARAEAAAYAVRKGLV